MTQKELEQIKAEVMTLDIIGTTWVAVGDYSEARAENARLAQENERLAGFVDKYRRHAQATIARAEAAESRVAELEAGRGVVVKPLEWRSSYGILRAETPFGDYRVAGKILHRLGSPAPQSVHDNPEAAKAAAQADYEDRIISAITTTPAEAIALASLTHGNK